MFLNDCKEIFNDRNNFECFELVNPFKDFNKYGNDRPSLLELTKFDNTIFNILISMMEFKIGIILKNFTRKMIKKDLNKMAW